MTNADLLTWRLRLGFPVALPGRQGPPKGDLSAHRIRVIDRCAQEHAFARVDRVQVPVDLGPRLRGSLVHAALDAVARVSLAGGPAVPTMEKLRAAFDAEAARLRTPTAILTEAWALLQAWAKPRLIVGGLLDLGRVVASEESFKLEVAGDAVMGPPFTVVGIFDRVDADEAGVVTVHDYKTGGDVQPVRDLLTEPQTQLYVAALRAHWSGPLRFAYHFLGAGDGITVAFDVPADLAAQGLGLARTKMAELRALEAEGRYPARTGPHCVRCDFRSVCPAYAGLLAGDQVELRVGQTDAELLQERQRCSALAKVFEAHRLACDAQLRARLDTVAAVTGGGLRAKLVSRPRRKLVDDLVAVAHAVAKAVGRPLETVQAAIQGVSDRKLERFVAALPAPEATQAEVAVDHLRQVVDVTTYVDVR